MSESRRRLMGDVTHTVIVTGAGGWLGGALVDRLARTGRYTVVGLDRAKGDLATGGVFQALIAGRSAATVVHLAASLDRSDVGKESQWRDTFRAGRHVIQGCVGVGVRHLMVAGSMEELGSAAGVLQLDVSGYPGTTYGLCKTLLRHLAEFEARQHPIRIDWFRPTVVYGAGQRGQMLIPSACEAAVSGRSLNVTDGKQIRDFLYVDDLVRWIEMAIERELSEPDGRPGFELHHIGSGHPTAVNEVLDLIEAGIPGARFHRGARPRGDQEPEVQVAPTNGTTVSNWHPVVSLRDGMTRTIEFWKSEHLHT